MVFSLFGNDFLGRVISFFPPFLFLFTLFIWPVEFSVNVNAWRASMDVSHIPLFFLIALSVHKLLQHQGHSRVFVKTITVSFFLIVLIELVQPMFGRTASVNDIFYGVAGVFLGVMWCHYWPKFASFKQRLLFIAALLIFFFTSSSQAWIEWYAVHFRDANMPTLGSFEHKIEQRVWLAYGGSEISRVREHATDKTHSLKVSTAPRHWSGVSYPAADADWSSYGSLHFDIYNPGAKFTLGLRIDDAGPSEQYEQRFNRALVLVKGKNTFVINLKNMGKEVVSGDFDLQNIRKLFLFTGLDEPPRRFYLDNVKLK